MGLFDRLFNKQERAASGSPIYRHGEGTPRPMGAPEAPVEWVAEREQFYGRFFGECQHVIHELLPLIPHIDIYVYPPQSKRDFYTLITGGMSDCPMKTPQGVPVEGQRIELYMRVPTLETSAPLSTQHSWEINGLRFLSRFPFEHNTWFGPMHTMPNGQPSEPIVPGSQLTTMLFMPAAFEAKDFTEGVTYSDGTRASFLWIDFLTDAECEYKLKHGGNAIFDLFDKHKHPRVTNINRQSYI